MGLARETPTLLLEEMTVTPCRKAGPWEPKRGHAPHRSNPAPSPGGACRHRRL